VLDPHAISTFIRRNAQTRLYEPNMNHAETMPYGLQVDQAYGNSGIVTVNAAGSATPPVFFKLPHASVGGADRGLGNPLKIEKIVFTDNTDGTDASAVTVMIRDMGDGRQFMNRPVHIRTLMGTAKLSARTWEPLFLPMMHGLQMQFDKITGASVELRPVLHGPIYYCWSQELARNPQARDQMHALVQKWLRRRKGAYPFWLTTETAIVMGANKTVEADMLIGDDGSFEGSHFCYVSTGDFQMSVFNPLTKQTIMNGTIRASGALGDARYPQELPAPWLVPQGERLRARFTDLSGSSNTVYYTVRGRKVLGPLTEIEKVAKQLA
jgi:hypothetical protein